MTPLDLPFAEALVAFGLFMSGAGLFLIGYRAGHATGHARGWRDGENTGFLNGRRSERESVSRDAVARPIFRANGAERIPRTLAEYYGQPLPKQQEAGK